MSLAVGNAPAQAAPLSRGLLRLAGWVAAIGVVFAHLTWSHPQFDLEARLYAGLLGAMTVMSLAYLKPGQFPALPMLLAQFYLGMGFPTFSEPELFGIYGRVRLSSRCLTAASLGSLVFAGSMVVFSFLGRPLGRRAAPSVIRHLEPARDARGWVSSALLLVGCLGAILYILVQRGGTPRPIAFIAYAFSTPPTSLSPLIWEVVQTGSRRARILLVGTTGMMVFAGLLTGMLSNALAPIFAVGLALWFLRGRAPMLLASAGLVVFIVLSPVKHIYRTLTWEKQNQVSTEQRIDNWVEAFDRTYSNRDSKASVEQSTKISKDRLSMLTQVAQVFEWVPRFVPYAGPELWLASPLELIPRVFWPEKPLHVLLFNKTYTRTFRLQKGSYREQTTINLPSVADGYWRLGWLGVVFEGALLGFLAGFFEALASRRSLATLTLGVTFLGATQPTVHVITNVTSLPQLCFAVGLVLLAVRLCGVIANRVGRPVLLEPARSAGSAGRSL
ncbi:MAG: hypothetical protein QM778_08785 [Myxococcales bacterium]